MSDQLDFIYEMIAFDIECEVAMSSYVMSLFTLARL